MNMKIVMGDARKPGTAGVYQELQILSHSPQERPTCLHLDLGLHKFTKRATLKSSLHNSHHQNTQPGPPLLLHQDAHSGAPSDC